MTEPVGNKLPSPEELDKMSFVQLSDLREKYKGTPEDEVIAPYEHKSYARGVASENPIAGLGLTIATPGYTLAKLTDKFMQTNPEGFDKLANMMPSLKFAKLAGRMATNVGDATPPSMQQMLSGLEGAAQGAGDYLKANVVEPWKRMWNDKVEQEPPIPSTTKPAPWERDWSKPGETKTPTVNMNPSPVNVSTNQRMLSALEIKPNEVMPDTRSLESNISELKDEINRTPHEAGKKVLRAELAKLEGR